MAQLRRINKSPYSVGEEVARGGTSTIYTVLQHQFNKAVLAKVAKHRKNAPDVKQFEDLEREVDFLNQCEGNPFVIELFDSFLVETDVKTELWLLVERMTCDLGALLEVKSKLSLDQVAVISSYLVEAVEFLHSKGIIHKDLKLENVLLSQEDGSVKLCDFGNSETFQPDIKHKVSRRVGTLYTMAPDLFVVGAEYDESIDIWSLGVIAKLLSVDRTGPSRGAFRDYRGFRKDFLEDARRLLELSRYPYVFYKCVLGEESCVYFAEVCEDESAIRAVATLEDRGHVDGNAEVLEAAKQKKELCRFAHACLGLDERPSATELRSLPFVRDWFLEQNEDKRKQTVIEVATMIDTKLAAKKAPLVEQGKEEKQKKSRLNLLSGLKGLFSSPRKMPAQTSPPTEEPSPVRKTEGDEVENVTL